MAIEEEEINQERFQEADSNSQYHQFDTMALHAGASPDPTTGALLTPIYQTTTYRQEAVGQHKGYTYSRSANPTVSALERRLAALEGAEFCTGYATGLATAFCLALRWLKQKRASRQTTKWKIGPKPFYMSLR